MSHRWSRRSFFSLTSGLSALGITAFAAKAWGQDPPPPYPINGADVFPQLDPSLVREAVGVSHANLPRLRELVEKQPALARASWDWGSGDWEACIDAAAHSAGLPDTHRQGNSCRSAALGAICEQSGRLEYSRRP